MCTNIIGLLCLCCFPNTIYSNDLTGDILHSLNTQFLNKIKSNTICFNMWIASCDEKKELHKQLVNLIFHAIKENKIKTFNVNGFYTTFMATQIAYYIFQSLIFDVLNIEQNKVIHLLPLLDIPIHTINFVIPHDSYLTPSLIDEFKQAFKQLKDKFVNFDEDITALDRLLLDYKLELHLKNAVSKIDFTLLIEKIDKAFNEKNNAYNELYNSQKQMVSASFNSLNP